MSESESVVVRGANGFTESERQSWDDFVSGGWHLFAAINQGLADAGLPQTPDWRVLEALSRHDQMRISDLASATQISLSTVSRQITRLVETGRVERVVGEACDARQRWVRVSDEGKRFLVEASELRDKLVRKFVVDVVTPEEFAILGTAMIKVRQAVLADIAKS
ncbi:putative MarR family transcriptional regulator [Gordonia effusa NBRC 100432]|uniref:Putative MarR family transcriptional regulator n=1 Tax=Gordonia effusa NBRC 100432 TaxID=1077974 RepID=H0R564_9ACTN|nr:MarR family transcriptional regulator [Gordonia effusa]GAB20215.1 putative MarR family transcriptional regulator [Gordonia effusa NBRC 100432]